jgi:hypothetical protein
LKTEKRHSKADIKNDALKKYRREKINQQADMASVISPKQISV